MKFSYSEVWEDTILLLRSNASLVAALAGAFLFLPALLVGHFLPQAVPGDDLGAYLRDFGDYLRQNSIWLMLQALANAIGMIAILILVFARQGTSVGGALTAAIVILPFYFVAGLIANFIVLAGLILFIVPGLYLFARLVPLGPVVVAENRRNPLTAIARAFEVTKGNGWAVLGLVILVAIPGAILIQLVNILFGIVFGIAAGRDVAQLLRLIVTSAAAAALTVVLLLLYAALYRALAGSKSGPASGT
jgi:hypothetical protein